MNDSLPPGQPRATSLRLVPWIDIDFSKAVDYHLHTLFTDGTASVQQMAQASWEAGIAEILFSEHVRYTSDYFVDFVTGVKNQQHPGLTVHVGAETKILDLEGHLDCHPEIATMSTALIGSVHSLPPESNGTIRRWSKLDAEAALELEFQLAMAIVTKSSAHILGHPLGMVISHFKLCPYAHLLELAKACQSYDKAFELNARYCSDPATWIEIVQIAKCKVSLGSDAHSPTAIGNAWKMFVRNGVSV